MFIEQNNKVYYYHYDGLGSVTSLTDKNRKIVQSYDYDSFGNLKRQGNKVKNSFTYTGREYDKETELYYYRNRYYDPKAGRFLTQDPIGFVNGLNLYAYVDSVGKPLLGTNLYTYADNDPVNFVDPWGLCKEKNWWNDKQFWEEFERRRLPGHELFGIPTDLIGVGSTGGIYVGTKVATDQAARAATSSFQSTNLGKYGVYVSGYRPGWFTVSRVISKGSLLVTVFYASSDVTAFVTTLYDYTLKK